MSFSVGDRVLLIGGSYEGNYGVVREIQTKQITVRMESYVRYGVHEMPIVAVGADRFGEEAPWIRFWTPSYLKIVSPIALRVHNDELIYI
jgi:hypothetical protein